MSDGPTQTVMTNRHLRTEQAESTSVAQANHVPDFEEYFRFLEQYWSLFDWQEAVRRCWTPGHYHDIRL